MAWVYQATKSRYCEPQRWQDLQCYRLRSAITYADLDQDVFRRLLGKLHKNIEVAVFVEDAGTQQLVLHVTAVAPLIRLDQIEIGILRLWILVQVLM
jgi:hypothetical protein